MDALAPPAAESPLDAYRAKLAAGELVTDPAQALAAERLQSLWRRLIGYQPLAPAAERGSAAPASAPTTSPKPTRTVFISSATSAAANPC